MYAYLTSIVGYLDITVAIAYLIAMVTIWLVKLHAMMCYQ